VRRLKSCIGANKESVELLLNYRKTGEPFWNLLYVSKYFLVPLPNRSMQLLRSHVHSPSTRRGGQNGVLPRWTNQLLHHNPQLLRHPPPPVYERGIRDRRRPLPRINRGIHQDGGFRPQLLLQSLSQQQGKVPRLARSRHGAEPNQQDRAAEFQRPDGHVLHHLLQGICLGPPNPYSL
jgi:hypothetical protein